MLNHEIYYAVIPAGAFILLRQSNNNSEFTFRSLCDYIAYELFGLGICPFACYFRFIQLWAEAISLFLSYLKKGVEQILSNTYMQAFSLFEKHYFPMHTFSLEN